MQSGDWNNFGLRWLRKLILLYPTCKVGVESEESEGYMYGEYVKEYTIYMGEVN
jgi:hypothetical protein